ncbi:MAG: hypothetical protein I3J02_10910 [Prevotella sp.]|nr:hypothetical protein [Prevotella sp.]
MKKRLYTAALTFTLSLTAIGAWADNGNGGNDATNHSSTYYINAPRFVRPLVEKWIDEYKKANPNADFAIAKTATNKKNSSLSILIQQEKDANTAGKTVYFAQYAIVPVTSKDSEADKALSKRALNAKTLKKLFFFGDDLDEAENKDKITDQVVVYAGNSSTSLAAPFASYYGEQAGNFRGKRIAGDDAYLISAIAEDPKGVTFNALPNVYDLQSRQLKGDLAVLPLDISKEQKASFTSLDNLIGTLESTEIKGIPVEKVGFSYADNHAIDGFVAWILANGTAYNHQFGLLQLNHKDAAQESSKVNQLTAQK